jgi:predicted nucleotidyltransferase
LREGWAKFALERYRRLKMWRLFATIIAKACKEVLGDSCETIYVVGGAAEDRLTVLSDIDIVAVVREALLKGLDTILLIKRKAEELGLPDDVPIDLKVMTIEDFQDLLHKGIYKKAVEVKL